MNRLGGIDLAPLAGGSRASARSRSSTSRPPGSRTTPALARSSSSARVLLDPGDGARPRRRDAAATPARRCRAPSSASRASPTPRSRARRARIDARDDARRRCAGARSSRTTPSSSGTSSSRWVGGELAQQRSTSTRRISSPSRTPTRPDLRLETFTRVLLGERGAPPRARRRARHARVVAAPGVRRARAASRVTRRRARARELRARLALARAAREAAATRATRPKRAPSSRSARAPKRPSPFDAEAIAAVLRDAARGARHFPGYRVRDAQIELALRFARVLERRRSRAARGRHGRREVARLSRRRDPVRDARSRAARESGDAAPGRDLDAHEAAPGPTALEGHPGGGALARPSVRCARSRSRGARTTRARGVSPACSPRRARRSSSPSSAAPMRCSPRARDRPHGELGSMPAALLRRHPPLRDLLRRSVAARAEHCSREQCAAERSCPFGRRRAALAQAHLVVANHDLLLRWPPDYPAFTHAIVDEAHELADVADEAYAPGCGPTRCSSASTSSSADALSARRRARREAATAAARREAPRRRATTHARGGAACSRISSRSAARSSARAGDFGEVPVPRRSPDANFAGAQAAQRRRERGAARRRGRARDEDEDRPRRRRARSARRAELRGAAARCALAFRRSRAMPSPPSRAGRRPSDRWRLAVRQVSPARRFPRALPRSGSNHFAGVSASLFVAGDAFAALGELSSSGRVEPGRGRVSVAEPVPVRRAHARRRARAAAAISSRRRSRCSRSRAAARRPDARTLHQPAPHARRRRAARRTPARRGLRRAGAAPRRRRSRARSSSASRQGGACCSARARSGRASTSRRPALQAVVIEKLPFEVPTELRRRREARIKRAGHDAFERYALGKMLLNLKQMAGRLIRSEDDRGIVVIVECGRRSATSGGSPRRCRRARAWCWRGGAISRRCWPKSASRPLTWGRSCSRCFLS